MGTELGLPFLRSGSGSGGGALSCLTSRGAWDGRDLDTACCEALFSGVRAMYGVTGPTGQRLLVMGIPGLGDSSYDYKGT